MLALLAASLMALSSCGSSPRNPFELPAGTPVVLIVIDTLRADHLSCYGYELETSPVLDTFAASSYLFEANSTQYNATFPSITSILTGQYPKTHGNYLPVPIEGAGGQGSVSASLADRFRRRDYYRIAIGSHPLWELIDPDVPMFVGWDTVSLIGGDIPVKERSLWSTAAYTNQRAFAALDEYQHSARDQPLFLWAHYFDPHTDLKGWVYNAPESTRNMFLREHLEAVGMASYHDALAPLEPAERGRWLRQNLQGPEFNRLRLANGRALYDAEIRSCDAGIGRLFERLRAMGVYDRALIVVAADHGENLEDPRDGHDTQPFSHHDLYEAVTHTPLIIKLPGQTEGHRVGALTQNVDIAPTIMELLDLPVQPPVDGRSLVPLLLDVEGQVHEEVFIEAQEQGDQAVKTTELKYIDRGEDAAPLVFDWINDPGEHRNLIDELEVETREALETAIKDYRPVHAMRIHVRPAEDPFEVSIELRTNGCPFDAVAGVPETCLEQGGEKFSWQGTVDRDPVDILLFRAHQRSEDHWRITHSGAQDLSQVVWLGKRPIAHTTVVPLWHSVPGDPPTNPQLEIERTAPDGLFTFRMHPEGEQELVAELVYADPSPEKDFKLVAVDGVPEDWGGMQSIERLNGILETTGAQPLSATLGTVAGEEVFTLFRFDGAWPDPRRVVVDGLPVATGRLDFAFPKPLDGRILAAARTGYFPDRTPAGSLVIWTESGGGGMALDTSGMDEELLRQLDALGYAD